MAFPLGEQKILDSDLSFLCFLWYSLDNLIAEAGPKNDIIFLLLCCSGRLCFVPLPFNDSLLRCECFSKITITTLQIIFRSGFLFFQQSDKTEGG